MMFDPFLLDESITPDSVKKTLKSQDWGKGTETVDIYSLGKSEAELLFFAALMMSVRLNEKQLIQEVLEGIPHTDGIISLASCL
jgi:hypothetical protein